MSDDPRLHSLIQVISDTEPLPPCDVVLLGFPHDEGVARNGGRIGAKEGNRLIDMTCHVGPNTFRTLYSSMGTRMNQEFGVELKGLRVVDWGDVGKGFGERSVGLLFFL